jgi:hypothetical protein
MDLSRITATIRPRTPWESIDLGFALARAWFLPLWLCWWVTAAPLALLALLPLHGRPDLWLLLLWWLKPGFEALPLYWMSRALFGERLSVATAARRLPQALPPRLWPQVLWRRIGITRSFSMPVTLLEAPRGGERTARLRVLGTGAAGWLTVVCVHLESVLWLSALLLLAFLSPEGLPQLDLATALLDSGSVPDWVASLLMLIAVSVLAPFYVAAGFALYLGRRTELEAWDIELAFRRAHPAPGRRRAMTSAAVLLLVAVLLPAGGPAQTLTREEARAAVDAVLADPDFGTTREERVWVYVGDGAAAGGDAVVPWLPAWLIQSVATAVKWLLLLAAATASALLALRLLRLLREVRAPDRHRVNAPHPRWMDSGETAGGDATALPLDIPAEVRRLLAAGENRGALALLYRAEIEQLRGAGLDLPDSATEAECLAAAHAGARPEQAAWLHRLVGLWQGVAYGHRPADPTALEALLSERPGAHLGAWPVPERAGRG